MIKKIIKHIFRMNKKEESEELKKNTEGVTAFEQNVEDQVIRVPTLTSRDEEANGED